MSSITDKLNDLDQVAERMKETRKPRWSEQWDRYFCAALTGVCADQNTVTSEGAVWFAMEVADKALEKRKEKFE